MTHLALVPLMQAMLHIIHTGVFHCRALPGTPKHPKTHRHLWSFDYGLSLLQNIISSPIKVNPTGDRPGASLDYGTDFNTFGQKRDIFTYRYILRPY